MAFTLLAQKRFHTGKDSIFGPILQVPRNQGSGVSIEVVELIRFHTANQIMQHAIREEANISHPISNVLSPIFSARELCLILH